MPESDEGIRPFRLSLNQHSIKERNNRADDSTVPTPSPERTID